MPDPIREQIIHAAVARVGEIQVSNGYNTDVGTNPGRSTKYAESGTTQEVVVIPRHEESEKNRYGKMIHTFPLGVQSFISFDPETDDPSAASEMLYADLVKALTNPLNPLSPLIDSIIHTGGGGEQMPVVESVLAGAIATFEIKYKTAVGDPSAQ